MQIMVDDEDYPRLVGYTWSVYRSRSGEWYATSRLRRAGGGWFTVYMHRLILNAPPGVEVDHRDGTLFSDRRLDNRKGNLRLATKVQNRRNRGINKNNRTGYKGVNRAGLKWMARIWVGGRNRYIGLFNTAEEAARMYDLWAWFNYGEFARFNFPEEWEHVRKAA